MACEDSFIECTSLSISYNIMGQATLSYTMVHKDANFCYVEGSLEFGNQVFTGYITDMTMNAITGTSNWYETHVTMTTTTN